MSYLARGPVRDEAETKEDIGGKPDLVAQGVEGQAGEPGLRKKGAFFRRHPGLEAQRERELPRARLRPRIQPGVVSEREVGGGREVAERGDGALRARDRGDEAETTPGEREKRSGRPVAEEAERARLDAARDDRVGATREETRHRPGIGVGAREEREGGHERACLEGAVDDDDAGPRCRKRDRARPRTTHDDDDPERTELRLRDVRLVADELAWRGGRDDHRRAEASAVAVTYERGLHAERGEGLGARDRDGGLSGAAHARPADADEERTKGAARDPALGAPEDDRGDERARDRPRPGAESAVALRAAEGEPVDTRPHGLDGEHARSIPRAAAVARGGGPPNYVFAVSALAYHRPMARIDALDLGRRAFARDEKRMAHAPHLLAIKAKKCGVSPFAFLRGHAPLFYSILEEAPDLEDGPSGSGYIVGDAHLENFGAYRVRRARTKKRSKPVAFDVNDFDDGCRGPHRYDVLRLATSLLLAARVYGETSAQTLDLLARLLDGYGAGAFGGREPRPPAIVRQLVAKVEARTSHAFLQERTRGTKARRRFVLGERYFALDPAVVAALPGALARYSAALAEPERLDPTEIELVDAAFRVAGNGSLGCLRIAALVRGRDDGWLFDLKEEDPKPSPHRLTKVRVRDPVARVLAAFVASVAEPPSRLGRTELLGKQLLVRRLTPQEDKLDVAELGRDAFVSLVPYLGALLGKAHARAADDPGKPHRRVDQDDLADRAIVVAGIHETACLAYAREAARKGLAP